MEFNKSIRILNKEISNSCPTFIIGEAGVNHGGDMILAKQLIDVAVEAGVDAVKFQAFRTDELIIDDVEKAPYQRLTTSNQESQTDMLRKLELKKEQYVELKNYCESKGILFLITPFDEVSLNELEEIGVLAYKVASTDTTNLPFLKLIAKTGKPILLSTGMTYLEEVRAALEEIYPFNKNVILMQCTANYPIKDSEANLNVINTFKEDFDVLVGYSDHSVGIGAAPYAVPMGVCLVEKHFTIDRNAQGPDHLASLTPDELNGLVKEIRRIESYLGSSIKKPTDSESQTRNSLQKRLVAKKEIKKGELFSESNLVAKRTGGVGISPLEYKNIIGKKAEKDFAINSIIQL